MQPRTLYNEVMGDAERERLVEGIVDHAGAPEVTEPMAQRVIAYWASVDPGLGARVAAGLGHGDGPAGGGSNGASAEASEPLAARANRA